MRLFIIFLNAVKGDLLRQKHKENVIEPVREKKNTDSQRIHPSVNFNPYHIFRTIPGVHSPCCTGTLLCLCSKNHQSRSRLSFKKCAGGGGSTVYR